MCRNRLLVIHGNPGNLEFPWGSKLFFSGKSLQGSCLEIMDNSSLEASQHGSLFLRTLVFCQSLTPGLVESYWKIKEAGQKFEVILVSADRSEDLYSNSTSVRCPGLLSPTLRTPVLCLNWLFGIQGIPTLIVLDPQCQVKVLTEEEDCREFPWDNMPVLGAVCLILFVDSEDDGKSQAAKQVIQPIAEKITAKYKAKEEAPLLFFMVEENDMIDYLRDYTNLPEATGHGSLGQVHDGCGDQPYHRRGLLNDS